MHLSKKVKQPISEEALLSSSLGKQMRLFTQNRYS